MTILVAVVLLMLNVMTGCSQQYSPQNEDDVAGKILSIGDPVSISFDVTDKDLVKTAFFINPTRGRIKVELISDSWTGVTVNLFDARYDEKIQTGKLNTQGESVAFTNLSRENTYYFEFEKTEAQEDADTETLILGFSK